MQRSRTRPRRRWLKVEFYEPHRIPGARALARSEWHECARWVVMFGLDFAEVFAVAPLRLGLAS
jgi:hypothetical protein